MNIKYYFLLIAALLSLNLKAQQSIKKLDVFQDSLIRISTATIAAETDIKKTVSNSTFVKTLVEALKTPNSFTYPFDSLKNVSVIKSPDKSFRILSWYVQQENGTYRYFGTIQMNTNNGPLKLYPLIDQTDNITDANAVNNNQKWFGARYYEIVPVTSGNRKPYYVLLGWKGNTPSTTKKVIEILSFDQEQVYFGAPVFEGKELKDKNRVIFEYTKSNAMTLKVDQKAGMIVFDHLAPFDSDMIGKYEFYGSDGTFDGFKIIGGKLKLQEGLELNNDPHAMDEQYADPKKNVKPIRKF
ncbi:hypothetical protein EV200_10796 [Pedobacter psychrotolerans]|uniref:Uncharacterized protein n=1 Tax=Pedobacter psychrotolerans TaxID=1843235 RepID=A0A4R2H6R6_9SPHI|nr:hypothetical protein [Pedobacter psychrotolerans]TCO21502.1 hypothetical protein EV200_10796 [Pedobacter psychrotolerans]GGE39112.1 hypothetical protein GCM10011413_00870 [Pedobacter psychrotolerans]